MSPVLPDAPAPAPAWRETALLLGLALVAACIQFCDAYAPFLASLTRDPRAEVVAEDPTWLAVQLHPAPRPP